MKNTANKVTNVLGGLISYVLLMLIVGVVFPLIPPFRGYYHTRAVLTGSMGHVVPTGALIINHYSTDRGLKVGDIITYQRPDAVPPVYITHRIVSVDTSGLLYRFQTKGDANATKDTGSITQANIEGRVIAVIHIWAI